MTSNELITRADLKEFRTELLTDLKKLLRPEAGEAKKWLKSREVRKVLGISPGTLQNMRINGTLRFTKIGGIVYYKMDDIYSLLEGGDKKMV